MYFDPAMKTLIGTPVFCTYIDFKLLMMRNLPLPSEVWS